MSFESLKLSAPLLRAISDLGYSSPTSIQSKAIPAIQTGRDVLAVARTGTGKTAGFVLPVLDILGKRNSRESNQARALVLAPTRELVVQLAESISALARYTELRSAAVYGGVKINPQMQLLRKGADILVATPGRLLDLHGKNAIRFDHLEVLILDEADRMLDLGFSKEVSGILDILPGKRQNLMFSGTFVPQVQTLARKIVRKPIEIGVVATGKAAENIRQWLIPVDKKRKPALLLHLLREHQWPLVLVFVRSKKGADQLVTFLDRQGISSDALHGDKSQAVRLRTLDRFKNRELQVLVATDIAARGIDIEQLPQVVNFDLPNVAENYVHRIGRTARAGEKGEAVSLVSADEHPQLMEIERFIQSLIVREYEPGYEPRHELPVSVLNTKPYKPKKPKKKKLAQQRARVAPEPKRARRNTRGGR